MAGVRIAKADVRRPDLRWPFPVGMSDRLAGARVNQLRRRSKYILADLDTGESLLIHLGMSGRMIVEGAQMGEFHHPQTTPGKHDHVVLDMETGARIVFNDARRFGAMDLLKTDQADAHPLISVLGPEPFSNEFNEDYLIARLSGKMTPIKAALLDQRLIAGLGNIYVCEALYRAGIHPARKAARISARRVAGLVPIIREVLSEAIEAGGSSLRDYRQADGDLGYFQHRFRVYGRENEPCRTPDCPDVVRRIVQSGRSSFYCAKCQR